MQPEGVVFDAVPQPGAESEMKELARLADSLVEQLADTRQHYEQIRAELDGYEGRPPEPGPGITRTQAHEPAGDHPAAASEDRAEGVRLFALSLALTGASREDVMAELHEKFGVDDAGDILDGVFPQTARSRERRRRFGRRAGR